MTDAAAIPAPIEPDTVDTDATVDAVGPGRRRDAAHTRRQLLEVARRRFARDGYNTTTLRDITDEAGVNVALVSRYFSSKEGLFEACLVSAVDDWGPTTGEQGDAPDVATLVAGRLAGPRGPEHTHKMVLLLRSSGDGRAEEIRLGILRDFTRRLAGTGRPVTDDASLELNAQIALATLLGVALLRSSTTLQPLTSAQETDLVRPLRTVLQALLG